MSKETQGFHFRELYKQYPEEAIWLLDRAFPLLYFITRDVYYVKLLRHRERGLSYYFPEFTQGKNSYEFLQSLIESNYLLFDILKKRKQVRPLFYFLYIAGTDKFDILDCLVKYYLVMSSKKYLMWLADAYFCRFIVNVVPVLYRLKRREKEGKAGIQVGWRVVRKDEKIELKPLFIGDIEDKNLRYDGTWVEMEQAKKWHRPKTKIVYLNDIVRYLEESWKRVVNKIRKDEMKISELKFLQKQIYKYPLYKWFKEGKIIPVMIWADKQKKKEEEKKGGKDE